MASSLRSRARSSSADSGSGWDPPPLQRPSRARRRNWVREAAATAAAAAAASSNVAQEAAALAALANVTTSVGTSVFRHASSSGRNRVVSASATTVVAAATTSSSSLRSDGLSPARLAVPAVAAPASPPPTPLPADSNKENRGLSGRRSAVSSDGGSSYHGLRCRESSDMWSFEYEGDDGVTSVRGGVVGATNGGGGNSLGFGIGTNTSVLGSVLLSSRSSGDPLESGAISRRRRRCSSGGQGQRGPLVSLARTPLCRTGGRAVRVKNHVAASTFRDLDGGGGAGGDTSDSQPPPEDEDDESATTDGEGVGVLDDPVGVGPGAAANVEPEHDDVHCTCSNEHVITTSIRGLTCDPRMFERLDHPELCEVSLSYLLVYVPKDEDFCQKVCYAVDLSDESFRLGQGSFGEVWPLDRQRVLKIARKHSETVLTVWMSGLIRTRAAGDEQQPPSLAGTGVYRGLLTATGCCLLHNVTVHRRFHTDLFHHDHWKLACVDSYRRAFCTLADAIKFLNHRCRVCHFDITPMNVLIDVNPRNPSEIVRAALCDYSLSEPYPDCNDRCVAVFQETGTARRIPNCSHRLRECYHPAFRPMPLQKLVVCNPHARFPVSGLRRFCMAELAALGNVLGFCLMRLLDRRGLDEVRLGSEALLFKHAGAACRALENGKLQQCADACLLIMGAQISYHACLLGEHGDSLLPHALRFVDNKVSSCRVRAFRRFYTECSHVMLHEYVRKNLERLLATADGLYLYNAFRRATTITCEEDLDADCRQMFPE
ncbi:tegument serine/threonine protein kinase [Panine betaherpesvirus 2]|uniref:Tegument serine/threonine protein kinase n=1 Tax=Panine betaherpesvirus 2 TaxID=188763 RepID=Q8QS03_9BETA|nr:tegument serine/threonine protein kinase [Panine betaherpesvirus 2]AAM00735.1 tegument serine/threonine protein kinase [Panine betaherpesvirus 2]QXV67846.1 tegument serine/threonine protein kinase [Panine betaherpesvirus 2]